MKQFIIRNAPILIVFLLLIIIPIISMAAGTDPAPAPTGLVPCSTGCGFQDILTLVNNVIDFLLTKMVIPIAAIMFAYAGFELVSSGGSTEKKGIAKKVFTDAVVGLIIAVAATLIVKLILSIAGFTGPSLLF